MEPIQGNVSIDAQNIMPIIKKWLYSDKDIFIREVVSNGCDAITKLRMVDSAAAQNCSIHVEVDKAARELRFIDDGIGMTEDEVKTNINQVAFSGAKSFMEEYAKNEDKENSGIIGHFGLGFYSVFMIADQVTIDTLSFREGAAPVRWESEDGMAFTMTEGTRTARGTTITIVSLLNLTAMAGVAGAGGLGDFAIRYGHDRNMVDITNVTVLVLVIIVCIMEFIGGQVVRKNTH